MTSSERRNWVELPMEVTALIFSRLRAVEILMSAQFVCKTWLEVSKSPFLWSSIDMDDIGDLLFTLNMNTFGAYLDKLCRVAFDRSCGLAVDISIRLFGSDDLLNYITHRTSRIKYLRLTQCDGVSEQGLIDTVAKQPWLEELELTHCFNITAETVTGIGSHCPRLSSFKLNYKEYGFRSRENEVAFAVGNTMPGLRTLQLTMNYMNDSGLEAILDGCPELESLDVRECNQIFMGGQVWKRCREQVKQLRHPRELARGHLMRISRGIPRSGVADHDREKTQPSSSS